MEAGCLSFEDHNYTRMDNVCIYGKLDGNVDCLNIEVVMRTFHTETK